MKKTIIILLISLLTIGFTGCLEEDSKKQPTSASGVKKAQVKVPTNASGLTTEQQNIKDRLIEDNKPGAIKHLYVISAYSGQVIIYSTVRGKVTSGGKRLTPTSIAAMDGQYVGSDHEGIAVNLGGHIYRTPEVLQDDGTYGHSDSYLYWWDSKGIYHQHYISGGQIVHISTQPLAVKGIIINMELTTE